MKSSDRLLLGIVIGAVIVAVSAFFIVLNIPDVQYQMDDTPEGVTHNYLLALQEEDYEKAYTYIFSDLKNYPKNVAEFRSELDKFGDRFRSGESVSLTVIDSNISGETAFIEVRETTFYQGDMIFSNQYTNNFDVTLKLTEDGWRISDSDSYFAYCWGEEGVGRSSCD